VRFPVIVLVNDKVVIDFSPVYALYDCSRTIAIALSILLVTDNAFMIGILVFAVPDIRFDDACRMAFVPPKLGLFGYNLFSTPLL
jgi:hypothetical protein